MEASADVLNVDKAHHSKTNHYRVVIMSTVIVINTFLLWQPAVHISTTVKKKFFATRLDMSNKPNHSAVLEARSKTLE